MKIMAVLLCLVILLTGCAAKDGELDRAMGLRAKMLAGTVSFKVDITADYGDKIHEFSMDCQADSKGGLTFTVTKPEVIAGISGTVSATGGKLTFGDTALAFELMADEQLSPVSGPWVLMNTLKSGYLTSVTTEGELLRLAIDDSYEDDALHLDIWLDKNDAPVRGEILWQGRRLLSMDVKDFVFL